MLLAGGVLWYAGIFQTRADTLRPALKAHAPDIFASVEAAFNRQREDPIKNGKSQVSFLRPAPDALVATRAQSIDYAMLDP